MNNAAALPPDVSPRDTDLVTDTLAALSTEPVAVVALPERPGVTGEWPRWVDPALRAALTDQGVSGLWEHQVRAAEAAWRGRHTVIATGTASGKSLAYWLPALTAAMGGTRATTIYCTPTKALAQDQRARIDSLGLPGVNPACYDGDTDHSVRASLRRSSRFVLTNPDMLHRGILPRHAPWRAFLARLRFVVLDEGHMYRGIFGANVAAVMTRLRRLARAAGSDPVFVVCSATYGDPAESAARLLGVPPCDIEAVSEDTSTRGPRTVILHDPSQAPDGSDPVSAFAETAAALTAWTDAGVRSVGFMRSRAGVESLAATVQARVTDSRDAVTAYRGGLLPEERRDIERRLREGELRSVAATNALELGVDIAGLDAVAMCGWPGTRLSFLQQLGRAGRAGGHAVALLAAQADPLDRFYVRNPDRIFGNSLEACVLDRDNPFVLLGHIACALSEGPLTTVEVRAAFGRSADAVLAALERQGLIRDRGGRWFWVSDTRADELVDLRGASAPVSIVDAGTGRVIGTVDGSSAPAHLHPGAVYTHLGATYLVDSLDLEAAVALARPADPGYTTTAHSTSRLRILGDDEQRPLGAATLHVGRVEVTGQVTGFLRRDARSGRVLGSEPLAMPPRHLRTTAVWWRMTADAVRRELPGTDLAGAAHAAEHAAIGVLPALATCDRWDIGGLSTECHADTGELTVFIYDGHPGGAGFARRGYDSAEQWLRDTCHVVETCGCAGGCPGCVQSPKCGNGNEPLDKSGAVRMLRSMIGAP